VDLTTAKILWNSVSSAHQMQNTPVPMLWTSTLKCQWSADMNTCGSRKTKFLMHSWKNMIYGTRSTRICALWSSPGYVWAITGRHHCKQIRN
jgi:hypothetical protein